MYAVNRFRPIRGVILLEGFFDISTLLEKHEDQSTDRNKCHDEGGKKIPSSWSRPTKIDSSEVSKKLKVLYGNAARNERRKMKNGRTTVLSRSSA